MVARVATTLNERAFILAELEAGSRRAILVLYLDELLLNFDKHFLEP